MIRNYARQHLRVFAVAFVLSCSAPASSQSPAPKPLDWQEFKSASGSFSVKLPGAPVIQDYELKKGPLNLTRHAHSLSVEAYVFHVEYIDYPKGYIDSSLSLEGGISGFRHTILADGGSLLSETNLTRGNCAGREATFVFQPKRPNNPQFWHGRIFLSGQRLYLMIFTSDNDSGAAREVGRTFIESFTVTGGCPSLVTPTTGPSAPLKVQMVEGNPDPSGWRRIDSPLGFTILMPGVVTYEAEEAQVEPFPITHHTFSHTTEPSVYSVEVFGKYPPDFRSSDVHHQTAIDLMLAKVKKTLDPLEFKIAPVRELRLATSSGREFSVSHEKLGSGRLQIYSTPLYIYVVIGLHRHSPTAASSLDRFFASLKISPR